MTPDSAFDFMLTHPIWLAVWAMLVLASLAFLERDLWLENPRLGTLMKWVWRFTVLYSGPLGLAVYAYAGRRQIPRDSLWRRAFRSVAHCYSGCGAGEVIGVVVTAGIFGLGTFWVAGATFLLAYAMGFSLTAGPLLQEGVELKTALWDSFTSETASITVMEVVAIGTDIWLSAGAAITEPLFWSAMVVSMTAGLAAAYPVNVVMIAMGVKAGMGSPAESHGH